MRRIGHRGAAGHAAGNTVESFERAIELGCDELETDVWLYEGRLVISHDEPTSGGVAGGSPPAMTLDDVIELCRGRIWLQVEVKARPDARAARDTAAEVARRLVDARALASISSFRWPALAATRAVPRALIFAEPVLGVVDRAVALGLYALHPAHELVTPELVAAAHAEGLRVNAWTANEPADIARLVALGVDGIVSDFPERVPK